MTILNTGILSDYAIGLALSTEFLPDLMYESWDLQHKLARVTPSAVHKSLSK